MSSIRDMEKREIPVPSSLEGIDVEQIEAELESLWRRPASSSKPESESGVTRACALNLIFYGPTDEDRKRIDAMLDVVAEHHPGRILLLLAVPEADDEDLAASVLTRCRRVGTSSEVCSEQVNIVARGRRVDLAASAVAALLVPDVSVFLVWRDPPSRENRLWRYLLPLADRIIVDSSYFDNPAEDLNVLASAIVEEENARLSDLNWSRLTTLRTLIASFWDVPSYRVHLDQISTVEFVYRQSSLRPDTPSPKALFLLAWLASRLKWDIRGGSKNGASQFELSFATPAHEISARLTGVEPAADSDELISLTLKCQTMAEFAVEASGGVRLTTRAAVPGEVPSQRTVTDERLSDGEELSGEVSFLSRDTVFEEAVAEVNGFLPFILSK